MVRREADANIAFGYSNVHRQRWITEVAKTLPLFIMEENFTLFYRNIVKNESDVYLLTLH